jgi:hypothetical protein
VSEEDSPPACEETKRKIVAVKEGAHG